MPESTVELLKRAVDAQRRVIDKPRPDRRELIEEARQADAEKARGKQ